MFYPKGESISRAKPNEAWCRLPGEVFGNTVLQGLCKAGLGTALGIAALAASVATEEPKGRRVDSGEDGGRSRSRLHEAFAFPSLQSSRGFCIFMVCSERQRTGQAFKSKIKQEKKPLLSALNRRHVIKIPPEVTESPVSKLPMLSPCQSCQDFAALPLRRRPRHRWQAEPPKPIVGSLAARGGFWQVNKTLGVGRPLS